MKVILEYLECEFSLNNPIVEVRFSDVYPVSLGALEYNQNETDVNYLSVSADFDYKLYEN